jgi:hypothetical protein
VARKLPRVMWCWWCAWQGLRGGGASGRWRDRAAAELELTGAVVRAARVRESEIGLLSELQWVAAVLLEHWITGVGWRRRLMTTSRGSGGAPAKVVERRKEGEAMRCGEWVKEVERDSWASFKTRRSTVRVKQLLASRRACVAARAAAARRGGVGRGPARGDERRARALEGTWRGEERRGGSWGSGNGR